MLQALAFGERSPEEVAEWANQWVLSHDVPSGYDPPVWDALDALAGADLEMAPGQYLHSDVDYRNWLEQFDRSVASGWR
jgi:hypothetical protein